MQACWGSVASVSTHNCWQIASTVVAAHRRGPPVHKLYSMRPVMSPGAESPALRHVQNKGASIALACTPTNISEWHTKSILHEVSTLC